MKSSVEIIQCLIRFLLAISGSHYSHCIHITNKDSFQIVGVRDAMPFVLEVIRFLWMCQHKHQYYCSPSLGSLSMCHCI